MVDHISPGNFFFFKEIFRLASDLTEYSFFIFSSYMDSNLSSFFRKICVETNNWNFSASLKNYWKTLHWKSAVRPKLIMKIFEGESFNRCKMRNYLQAT